MKNKLAEELKVCLDSRLVNSGDYFVPIKGENFDGHKFIDDAIKAGAAGIIEEEELYKLASEKLSRINPIVIAVTGSVGKSTMCSFISTILLEKHNVCVGKLNTKLGLAVNIMNDLKDNDYFFVAEAGMDKAGELTETGKFLNPDAVVITNISESHMEKLGSLDEIKKAKSEILKTVISGGTVYLNWDCSNIRDIVSEVPNEVTLITYGLLGDAKFDKSSADLLLSVEEDGYETFDEIPFSFIGKHNYLNALGAFAVVDEFGINVVNILNGMKKLKTPNGRLKLIDGIFGSIIVDDTYNSSPASLIGAI
ncbi:hypothetical protein CO178_01710 [candidate division WWE3 bacterium CG_4_9_14_3_um_filter_34_6]|uniref:Mur ligase central domain-containing protein n=1 Tax=candidate division WWE3 bacterium CG_4_9_14_3_um_filter_34_6 TaxID=1975079 RepID=A0A2M7X3I7_UNCKA|nr:MAG: hypothetical protein CO178_01710 [candidate division WWE3 bacterium CG_4_9_14_3_um_filter_34_6]